MVYMPVKLHADKFEQMIARRGRDVLWQQALLCPCWNTDSGQPNYNCRACKGKGYTYEAPTQERGLVMSVTANKEFDEAAGVFEIGDAVMTVPKRVFSALYQPGDTSGVPSFHYERENSMFEVGMFDLITLLDDEFRTAEILVKGTPIYGRPADTLINDKITAILKVRTSDPDTGEIFNYYPGDDFYLLEEGNTLIWIGDGHPQPAEGQQYSVIYKHRPVYIVTCILPKPRHQDGADLPRYVALRYRAGGFEPK